MRLRIVIRRQDLPETRVLWNIDTTSNPTIAQLLEQVNDIVPIESDDWGFEDYAVESNGFECIHYKGVTELLKDDEEIVIKPLSFRDLKVRQVSGRLQISSDGRHLVDGVPYGKPLLQQRPRNRPDIHIPPRKRARLAIAEGEIDNDSLSALEDAEEDGADDSRKQLVLHADFDADDSDDDEEDEDFTPLSEEDGNEQDEDDDSSSMSASGDDSSAHEDSEEEIITNHEGSAGGEEEDISRLEDKAIKDAVENEEVWEGIDDDATRMEIRQLHSAFPDATIAVCRHVYDGAHGDMVVSFEAMAQGFKAVKAKSDFSKIIQEGTKLPTPGCQSKSRKRSAEEFEDEDESSSDDAEDTLLNHYDQNGFPPGSIKSGKALSTMAEVVTKSPHRQPTQKRSITRARTSGSFPATSVADGFSSTPLLDEDLRNSDANDESSDATSDTSSDDDSDLNVEDEEVSDRLDDRTALKLEVEDTSTSGSDSDSENEAPEEESSKSVVDDTSDSASTDEDSSSDSGSDNSSSSSSSDDSSSEKETTKEFSAPKKTGLPATTKFASPASTVQPEKGKKATQKRNERRRRGIALKRFKQNGILPEDTTMHEFVQLEMDNKTSAEEALINLQSVRSMVTAKGAGEMADRVTAKMTEFDRRRTQLLTSIAAGGIEVDERKSKKSPAVEPQPPVHQVPSEAPQDQFTCTPAEALVISSQEGNSKPEIPQEDTSMNIDDTRPSTTPKANEGTSTPAYQPASTKSSQDRSARKTKVDIGAAKRMLFGSLGVRTPKNKQDAEKLQRTFMKDIRPTHVPKQTEEANADSTASDDDSESWREKINYRAVECCYDGVEYSAPPFPFKQRWDPQQNRKGMKRLREQSHYYEDSHVMKKHRKHNAKAVKQGSNIEALYKTGFQDDPMYAQYDDSEISIAPAEGRIEQQSRDNLHASTNEVTQIPEDLVTLPEDPSSLPQLEDGKAVVGMTIAFKELIMSEETGWQPQMSSYRTAIVIQIEEDGLLELRLAVRDRSVKIYDEETGERIFGRFDMPVDDDDNEDDGRRSLRYSELVEPKIVDELPILVDDDFASGEASQAKDGHGTDESATLSHGHEHEHEHEPEPEPEQESVEVPFSHVTETPLNSDAIDLHRGQIEETAPVKEVQSIGIEIKNPTTPATPMQIGEMEEISSENVRTLKQVFNEAGFRSSVLSVVLDDPTMNDTDSAGDEAVFNRLMNSVTTSSKMPYSPKAHGFRSSPSPQPGEQLNSFEGDQSLANIQTPTDKQSVHGKTPEPLVSSWQTIDSQEESCTAPAKALDNNGSWETATDEVPSSRSGAEDSPGPEEKGATPQTTPKKVLAPMHTSNNGPTSNDASGMHLEPQIDVATKVITAKKAPRRTIGKAKKLWEQFQTTRCEIPAIEPHHDSSDIFGLNGNEERESDTSVHYPNLPVGSSFSQTSDHGRQPDFNYEESTAMSVDTPRVSGLGDNNANATGIETEIPSHKSAKESINLDQPDDRFSIEPELSTRESARKFLDNVIDADDEESATKAQEDDRDVDSDGFPSLVSLSQPPPSYSQGPPKSDKELKYELSDLSDNDTTPKLSQKQRQPFTSHLFSSRPSQGASQVMPRNRRSNSRSSQPSHSQTRASQRKGSQLVDLTMSSDAEPKSDSDAETRPTDSIHLLSDDEGDNYEGGWVAKKENGIKGLQAKRHASVGLQNSSQTALNKNRRKTIAR